MENVLSVGASFTSLDFSTYFCGTLARLTLGPFIRRRSKEPIRE